MTSQEKTALNMAKFIRGQLLVLLDKLNSLDLDEQAELCEQLQEQADRLYQSLTTCMLE